MTQVTSLPIGRLVGMFLVYLIIHIIIGVVLNRKRNELVLSYKETTEKEIRTLEIWFKWFPAVAVAIIVILFYVI